MNRAVNGENIGGVSGEEVEKGIVNIGLMGV